MSTTTDTPSTEVADLAAEVMRLASAAAPAVAAYLDAAERLDEVRDAYVHATIGEPGHAIAEDAWIARADELDAVTGYTEARGLLYLVATLAHGAVGGVASDERLAELLDDHAALLATNGAEDGRVLHTPHFPGVIDADEAERRLRAAAAEAIEGLDARRPDYETGEWVTVRTHNAWADGVKAYHLEQLHEAGRLRIVDRFDHGALMDRCDGFSIDLDGTPFLVATNKGSMVVLDERDGGRR